MGASVYVQVFAQNAIGNGTMSVAGNGAIVSVIVVPNAPTSLVRDSITSTPTAIGINWSDGTSNGGSPILDYQVLHDQGNNTFVIVQAGITTKSYLISSL